MKVHYTGVVSFPQREFEGERKAPIYKGINSYSESVRTRIRKSEAALHGNAQGMGLKVELITLTFPQSFTNDDRWRINKRFRILFPKALKKAFPIGIWWTEVHTGEDYTDKVSKKKVLGNKEMKGMVHFHYKIGTTKTKKQILRWLKKQQIKDKVAINSYDISKKTEEQNYTEAYTVSKKQQQEIFTERRFWSCWGLDREPMTTYDMNDLYPYVIVKGVENEKAGMIYTKAPGIKKLIYERNNGTNASTQVKNLGNVR